ncbi:hypothetical protein QPM17_11850 [Marinobacter sp. TBZ242]|uniref:Uncharacterized protein n=1 Tax=Marinobacter azerbaijanicus TaxID=3050455 RepID=A0ABT7ICE2_9GAMM|nr:hypothetical protein [Marinobacter sp. TBZ242]MDL0431827.1 hypothetical protein [Marinobacter sp. TBZ242]
MLDQIKSTRIPAGQGEERDNEQQRHSDSRFTQPYSQRLADFEVIEEIA